MSGTSNYKWFNITKFKTVYLLPKIATAVIAIVYL